MPVQGLFGVVNVAKAFQEKLKLRTQKKDTEDMKEEEIERRKIKSVLTTTKGDYCHCMGMIALAMRLLRLRVRAHMGTTSCSCAHQQ